MTSDGTWDNTWDRDSARIPTSEADLAAWTVIYAALYAQGHHSPAWEADKAMYEWCARRDALTRFEANKQRSEQVAGKKT